MLKRFEISRKRCAQCAKHESENRMDIFSKINAVTLTVLKGLRPAIRLHVLKTNPTNMEELQSSAAIYEASLFASGVTDDVTKLTEQ